SAGENDGQGVACGELQEHSERDLRADYRHREENEAGGVHIESERDRQEENGREVSEKDATKRDWQRNDVGIIVALEQECVPAPDGCGAGHDHAQNDKEIFIRDGGGEWVEGAITAHPADKRA